MTSLENMTRSATDRGSTATAPGRSTPALAHWLLLGALVLVVVGMALVVLGTQMSALFMPGTWMILVSLLVFAVAGLLHLFPGRSAS